MIGARGGTLGGILRGMTSSTRPAAAPEQVLATAAGWSRGIAVGALVVGVGVVAVLPTAPASALTLTIAGIGLVAGLPHGSVDHILASRLTGRSPVLVTVAYAGAAVLAWLLIVALGPVALGTVVVLSLLHFGLGEAEVQRRLSGWYPGRAVTGALAVAGTGALLLPLARSGDLLHGVATAISPDLAAVLAATPVRLGLVVVWVVAAAVTVTAALRAGRRSVAVDVALIGALGAFAPPLIAFAVWFGGWHALRHSGRLLLTEPGCAALVTADRAGAAVRRLARLAAWPSVAATATLALLVGFTVAAPDPESAIAEVLRVLLALTVPHMLVVGWLDRRTSIS